MYLRYLARRSQSYSLGRLHELHQIPYPSMIRRTPVLAEQVSTAFQDPEVERLPLGHRNNDQVSYRLRDLASIEG
ncbi:hypothetical protein D3C86_1847760 [compost metagenome]